VAVDRERGGDRVEGEECLERVEVHLGGQLRLAHQRLQLGGEGEDARGGRVVERLDAEAVAREHQPAPARVPQRDTEHAAQLVHEARPALLVEVHEHLRVAAGREAVAALLEARHQLAVVVDLAVLDDVDGAVLVRDRLVAAGEVDDRQPAHREADGPVEQHAVAVRPAVHEGVVHGGQGGRITAADAVERRLAADAAHAARV
jgi:hypothetical protein